MVSQDPKTRTSRFCFVIRFVANARARVTANGRPSGTATTTRVTEIIRIWMNDWALTLADLEISAKSGCPYLPVGFAFELDEEADHESNEEEQSRQSTSFGDQLSEIVELQLEWCFLGISPHRYVGSA